MNWITDQIAIGNYLDGADVEGIEKAGIRSALCLDCNLKAPVGLKARRVVVHLVDGPAKQLDCFLKAVQTLERLVVEAGPVLVHCHAGRSRSVVVVAGYLMRARGIGPEEALKLVAAKREVMISRGVGDLLYYL